MKQLFSKIVWAFLFVSVLVITGCEIDGVLTANPETIEKGQSSTLAWELGQYSGKANNAVMEPGIGAVPVEGSVSVTPEETTTYTITWSNDEGSVSDKVTVTVVPPPEVTISANPQSVLKGSPTVLTWSATNADACSISPDIGTVGFSGTRTLTPTESTTYTITASGQFSNKTAEVNIYVYELPEVTISSDKQIIETGQSATLTWHSQNATSCSISPDIGSVELSDTYTITPAVTTTYTITASDGLHTESDTVTITVVDPPVVSLSVDQTSVDKGQPVTLSWTSENATSCSINKGIGNVELTDSMTITPGATTTYTITATGPVSAVTDTVSVTVIWPEPEIAFFASSDQVTYPNPVTLSWATTNATSVWLSDGIGYKELNGSLEVIPEETTTYTIKASNPTTSATAEQSITVVYNPPQILEFSVSEEEITHGDPVTLTWNVENAESVYINNGIGEVLPGESRVVTPDYTTTWILSAHSRGGAMTGEVSVKVTGNPPQPLPENTFGKKYQTLVPEDASLESYDEDRFVILTGFVYGIDEAPVPDVTVEIFGHPEYGTALTDTEGRFSIPADGGGVLKLVYTKEGYLTAHRQKETPWNEIAVFDDVTLIEEDDASTTFTFDGNPETIITHKSTEIIDTEFGNRSCTLVFTGDNRAWEVDQYGNKIQELSTIRTRATEYTTPASMPAVLPATSAFTYCAELAVDGAGRVVFDKPVVAYVDNFLNFPTGEPVPAGYYDVDKGEWIASKDGIVVELLDTDSDGFVDALDSDGDGTPNDLNEDGAFSDEVKGLTDTSVYSPGKTYWRVALPHFTPWDFNWPFGPPDDARYPNPKGPPETDSDDPVCFAKGTLVHTAVGLKPIEEVRIGDRVWSFNEETGDVRKSEVTRLYKTPDKQLYELIFRIDDTHTESILVTPEHPFMVKGHGWKEAKDLTTGDIITSRDGRILTFTERLPVPETRTVYNIRVKETHSYFVGESGALVHNACRGNVDPKKRVLHQDVPIPGTGMSLHYASNRLNAANKIKITVPASGSSVPASLSAIVVRLNLGGRLYTRILGPGPNQTTTFTLDNKDFLNNDISGTINAFISVGFKYNAVYRSSRPSGNYEGGGSSFGNSGGSSITTSIARQTFIFWKHYTLPVYIYPGADEDNRKNELAKGWTLSSNHCLDTGDLSTLYKGDGTIARNNMPVITKVAENAAGTYASGGVTVDAEGNLFYIASDMVIRKVDKNGEITEVACGDADNNNKLRNNGIPASNAWFSGLWISGLDVDSKGNIYISSAGQALDFDGCIYKIDRAGILTTVAGIETPEKFSREDVTQTTLDGIPATSLYIPQIYDVACDSEGNFYFSANPLVNSSSSSYYMYCILKVDRNGIITRIAGGYISVTGYSGDGGKATEAQINRPEGICFDKDGNLYFADSNNHRVRKVDTDGIITTVAGNGWHGYSGDGSAATAAQLNWPTDVAIDSGGNLLIADYRNNRIRKVDHSGKIHTVAGSGEYNTCNGDDGPAILAGIREPRRITVDSKGDLYIQSSCGTIRKVNLYSASSGNQSETETLYSDSNGLTFGINRAGRHTRTIDTDTGKTLLQFDYTPENSLQYITDQFGKQIEIRYNDDFNIDLISPYGTITALTLNADKCLEKVTYPDTGSYDFGYTAGGLMEWSTDPEENRSDYTYNALGRLTDVYDSEEGHMNYDRNSTADGNVLATITSAEGNQKTFLDHQYDSGRATSLTTEPSGETRQSTFSSDGLRATIDSDCRMDTGIVYGFDTEYLYKYIKEATVTSETGLTLTTTKEKNYEDTDGNETNDLITETVTTGGQTTSLVHNTLTTTKTITTPENRTITSTYNPNTLQTESVSVTGLNPVEYEYYPAGHLHYGRLRYIRTGDRQTEYVYYDNGNLHTITDPEEKVTTYEEYDPMNRVKTIRRPDNTTVQFEYDNNGNVTALITPSNERHEFGYNGVDSPDGYTTPHPRSYGYQYDKDHRLLRKIFPSDKEIYYDYNNGAGDKSLLRHVVTPEGTIDYSYACGSKVESMTKGGESVTWAYDGSLVTSETLAGTLNQTVSITYKNDGDFLPDGFTYAGATEAYGYDNDNMLTTSGSYTITRKPENGLPDTVTGNDLALARAFNAYGENNGETFTVNGTAIGSWEVTHRDLVGRIIEKTETINGTTTTYGYDYDDNGRLETVEKNGTIVETYGYTNYPAGTCTQRTNTLRGITAEDLGYDEEHRLLTAGSTSYTYDEDGYLTSKTNGADVTSYNYSSRGELLNVTLPDNTLIEYIHDPLGRRVAKKVDGTIIEKYLWSCLTTLLAVYDGADNLLMRFEYADGRLPVAMTKNGVLYYFAYNQVGSPLAIADASGNIVKQLSYDSWGYLLSDTNPTFKIPFGFAGGLHDRDTGLIRFGYRDYDPEVGRWTAKDPIGFNGGDTDLFGYCLSDPVNLVDPTGEIAPLLLLGGAIIGAASNALANYDAYSSGEMSLSNYLQSAAFGAGLGALSAFVPGGIQAAVFFGTGFSGLNDTMNQMMSGVDCINWNSTGKSMLYGAAGGVLGEAGGSIGARLMNPSKYGKDLLKNTRFGNGSLYDMTGKGTRPENLGNLGALTGTVLGTIISL